MENFLDVLADCPLFARISPADLPGMLACLQARPATFARGETVLHAGNAAEQVGVVLSGSLHIVQDGLDGSRRIIGHAEAGDLFAEAFACAGVELPVSVEAAQDSRVLLIPYARILSPCRQACGFHRQLMMNLMRILARKSLAFRQKLEIVSCRTTREKLLAYLQWQARQQGSASFTIPYDRQGLADFLGVDRSGLCTELGKLRDEGVLRFRKNAFTLLGNDG